MPQPSSGSATSRYLLLPARGMQTTANGDGLGFLLSLSHSVGTLATPSFSIAAAPNRKPRPKIKVLDSIHENGVKLVELSAQHAMELRTSEPGIRVVPEVMYRLAFVRFPTVARRSVQGGMSAKAAGVAASSAGSSFKVLVRGNGQPLAGATVVAFTDFANRIGAQGTTNSAGIAALKFKGASVTVERLYALPATGCWPAVKQGVKLSKSAVTAIDAPAIDFSLKDSVRHFYGTPSLSAGEGVKVGVLDCGIAGDHPDLRLDGGLNTVTGEAPGAFGDNGMEGHGTHVGGIIAARGSAPTGMRGVAPGVTLRSYRVFGQGAETASNFAIAKAIDAAVGDGCDLINMSLGGGSQDPATEDAISAAREAGTVVLASNGNDDRQPVSFPAAFDLCLAVSAMGRKGTFPAGAATQDRVAKPSGTDPGDFMASFSNIGEDTDLTGPGVGVVSTVPSGYAVMDGTSMSCPAAVGALARRLAGKPAILTMTRNQARSNAIVALFAASTSPLGFGSIFEGSGMIGP